MSTDTQYIDKMKLERISVNNNIAKMALFKNEHRNLYDEMTVIEKELFNEQLQLLNRYSVILDERIDNANQREGIINGVKTNRKVAQ